MRRAARRDANEGPIVTACEAAGFTMLDFGKCGFGIPDRLALRRIGTGDDFTQWWAWVEIKAPGGKLRETQRLLRDLWEPSGHWIEARTPEQAVADLERLYRKAVEASE